MEYTIIDASRLDAPAIAALHADSWRAAYRGMLPDSFLDVQLDENRQLLWSERLSTLGDERRIVLKAVAGGAVLGFACVFLNEFDPSGALLDNLHVAPHLTGQGIGAELLRAAQHRVAAASNSHLHLFVFEANTRARRFYERHGAMLVDRQMVEVIPGARVPEVRYVFDVGRI